MRNDKDWPVLPMYNLIPDTRKFALGAHLVTKLNQGGARATVTELGRRGHFGLRAPGLPATKPTCLRMSTPHTTTKLAFVRVFRLPVTIRDHVFSMPVDPVFSSPFFVFDPSVNSLDVPSTNPFQICHDSGLMHWRSFRFPTP